MGDPAHFLLDKDTHKDIGFDKLDFGYRIERLLKNEAGLVYEKQVVVNVRVGRA